MDLERQFKRQLKRGDDSAFVELHHRFGNQMLRYLNSRLGPDDARDVFQEVFVRMFRHRRKLVKAKNLEAYLFLMTRNEAIRWANQSRRRARNEKASSASGDQAVCHPNEHRLENQELATALLVQLNPDEREVVELKIYSQLTFATISVILKVPAATAASRYRRAIQKLQAAWQNPEQDAAQRNQHSSDLLPSNSFAKQGNTS